MSIADKISRLQDAKTAIASSIIAKGGSVAKNDGFEEFPQDISNIDIGAVFEYTINSGELENGNLSGLITANIPEGVTSISNDAFQNNAVIQKVVFPESLISIADDPDGGQYNGGAFGYCTNLQSIQFSTNSQLSHIGAGTFARCSRLTKVLIADSVTSIGMGAFLSCSGLQIIKFSYTLATIPSGCCSGASSLRNVVIPKSVTSISPGAFKDTTITDVYYTGTEEDWNSISIGTGNDRLSSATKHFEYAGDGSEL